MKFSNTLLTAPLASLLIASSALGQTHSDAQAPASLLTEIHGVQWPWNMERDKRNAKASLAGADLIGFIPRGNGFRLALGEVKTSAEDKYPPQVMSGRSGMAHQIDTLASDFGVIFQVLKWLAPRCKGSGFENHYIASTTEYFNSGNKDAVLFGILIRDTPANELDLRARGEFLGGRVETPGTCNLMAVYLAPTRTLVNQVARQLRRDFAPLNIVVEQVSPALEIDGIEMDLLLERESQQIFRVLVMTPEKLDLMLRQGWEEKIGRPLTLVVVDEAHNIHDLHRGLKLELLLATINKECERAQFLLLTPFIRNAREVARWLGGANSDDVSLALDWQPNDRLIGIAQVRQGASLGANSFDYSVGLQAVHTTRQTLMVEEALVLPKVDNIASTFRQASDQSTLAAVVAQNLQKRGPVIVMHGRPDWVWSLAERLKVEANRFPAVPPNVLLFQEYLRLEFGENFPLVDLLNYGIAVHHAGLPDDVRSVVEWLFEEEQLKFLVATTTVAQGVNFPVTGVVMASHQYPMSKNPFRMDMPPEDFWNIAGRAGRVGHGQLGIVALVADDDEKAQELRVFINRQAGDLNSALIQLAIEAQDALGDLSAIVYSKPEWSSFLQYLAHTYRQMGEPESFIEEIEQILRGTLGFDKLRSQNSILARKLLEGIRTYGEYLQRPNQPLKLVDSTGFSLNSVNTVLTNKGNLDGSSWNSTTLFTAGSRTLQDMMGVLLRVPELRENLNEVTGGDFPDGDKLALIIKDWVNGESVVQIANRYFRNEGEDEISALTRCGKNLFGKLAQTASWGLGALLAITGTNLTDEAYKSLSNLPSRVFYGVNTDAAITLRLLGVPRSAATPLTALLSEHMALPLPQIRQKLVELREQDWNTALGDSGRVYRRIWRVLEGLER